MNAETWTILLAQIQREDRPIADRLRVLALMQRELTAEIFDVLHIAADGIEADEDEGEATE